tara:strand:+ start:304 stop:945 length:642 start_codon:yes stop_codon:yes gene_type:complete
MAGLLTAGPNQNTGPKLSADEVQTALYQAKQDWPILNDFNVDVVYNPKSNWTKEMGHSEFWHPKESRNPFGVGNTTIEIYNPNLDWQQVVNLIKREMTHRLQEKDPMFRKLRQQFKQNLSPRQLRIMKNWMYPHDVQRSKRKGDKPRSFDKWLDIAGLEELIGGRLMPIDKRTKDDWKGAFKDLGIKDDVIYKMRNYLEGPYKQYLPGKHRYE